MPNEAPVFRRCCFCIPLRYGLLVWGYLKLVSALLTTAVMIIALLDVSEKVESTHKTTGFVILSVILFFVILDIIFNTIFIVAAHKKNYKLLKTYYYYSIVMLIILVALYVVILGILIYRHTQMDIPVPDNKIIADAITHLGYIILQVYFILLIKSEAEKLEKNSNFRFVNNGIDSKCTMNV